MAKVIFNTNDELYNRDDMYSVFSYGVMLGRRRADGDHIEEFVKWVDDLLMDKNKPLNMDVIMQAVSEVERIPDKYIFDHGPGSRRKEYAKARHMFCWFSYLYTDATTLDISDYIWYKNHSSVVWSVKTINNLLEWDRRYRSSVDAVKLHLYNRGYALSMHHSALKENVELNIVE
jgi:hypothetical protein